MKPDTIFCDIDGTLVEHVSSSISARPEYKMKLLDGSLEKLLEWEKRGCQIILTTARKESLRKETERQLREVGIFYDKLIMGLSGGKRVLINDSKDGKKTAIGITVDRNTGIKEL